MPEELKEKMQLKKEKMKAILTNNDYTEIVTDKNIAGSNSIGDLTGGVPVDPSRIPPRRRKNF